MKTTWATVTGILLAIVLAVPAWAGRPVPDCGQMVYGINEMSFAKLDAAGNDLPDDAPEWAMVRDNVTGLIWEVKQNKDGAPDYSNPHDADNLYTWYDSSLEPPADGTPGDGTDTEDFINDLNAMNYGGFSDWRMPTREELRSIVDYSIPYPGPTIDTVYFPNTVSSNYWSSSTGAFFPGGAWSVDFYYGSDDFNLKSGLLYVRAVRGGQSRSLDHLVINFDGTVTDKRTGLMWQEATGGPLTWEFSLFICESMPTGYYTDWRFPTLKELASIVDMDKSDPSIDELVFPSNVSTHYWSSTAFADDPAHAWNIDFLNGGDGQGSKSDSHYIRAVRGGQSRIPGHLFILEPRQASAWNIGATMPIEWETAGIPGDVTISFSRDGGKTGTFVDLATTANDGFYEWPVTGPATVNGFLKITPLTDPGKATSTSLFSIEEFIVIDQKSPPDLSISEAPGSDVATFRIRLTSEPAAVVKIRLNSSHVGQFTVEPYSVTLNAVNWDQGATVTVTAVDNDIFDGDYNGKVHVTTQIEGVDPAYDGMVVVDIPVTVNDNERFESTDRSFEIVVGALTLPLTGGDRDGNGLIEANDAFLYQPGLFNINDQMDSISPMLDLRTIVLMGDQYIISATYFDPGTSGIYELEDSDPVQRFMFVAQDAYDRVSGTKAILIAGGGDSSENTLWPVVRNCANMAYRALRHQMVREDRIRYLIAESPGDADGDGSPETPNLPTRANIEDAIKNWAIYSEELYVYLTGPGKDGKIEIMPSEWLDAETLRDWLDVLQSGEGVKVTVIVDTPDAGAFIPALTPQQALHQESTRIVVAGSRADAPVCFLDDGEFSFSFLFWKTVLHKGDLYNSFVAAGEMLMDFGQQALIDRDQDGSPDAPEAVFPPKPIGLGEAVDDSFPNVSNVYADPSPMECEQTVALSGDAVADTDTGLSHVFVRIVPPGLLEATDNTLTLMPEVKLIDIDQNGDCDGTYKGVFDDFTQFGVYKIVFYARDRNDDISRPKALNLIRTCGAPNIKGDLNKDAENDLADAIIALQILTGFTPADFRTDYQTANIDVNGGDPPQVGMAEAIYALQKAAGVR